MMTAKPKVAVWKFASCDGCQLSLLDCEDELLAVADAIDIAYFLEATRETVEGPYDLSLVEGSVTTPYDAERIQKIREESAVLITLGACATTGGIQALKNNANVDDFVRTVYASPEFIDTLRSSDPISAHVKVDYELQGCPINKYQLVELIVAFVQKRKPRIPESSVCIECKRRGTICTLVARGEACMGPVTHAGCDAICPSYNRGCYGCYGPMENPNAASLDRRFAALGVSERDRERSFSSFYTNARAYRELRGEVVATTTEERP